MKPVGGAGDAKVPEVKGVHGWVKEIHRLSDRL